MCSKFMMISLLRIARRQMSMFNAAQPRLVYSGFGDPSSVLRLDEDYEVDVSESSEKEAGRVIVKMLAAPVNPADLNTIQGVYPLKPKQFPAVPGGEGVGVVVHTGPSTYDLKKGDMVVLTKQVVGTWQFMVSEHEESFTKVDKDLDLIAAATLVVNPPTALRMLTDFEKLKTGDTVVQNAGNSGVGIAVIQLCSHLGLKCISVVRNRDNIQVLKSYLEGLGKDSLVLTEEEFRTYKCKCQIAFNAVGGKAVADLARVLDFGRTIVTYGGMSRQPITVPTASLIFKDIVLKGFWMSRWKAETPKKTADDMYAYLANLYLEGKMQPPVVDCFSLHQYKKAISNTGKSLFML